MNKVVVVGGGIAGLAAAFHLQEQARAGAPVECLLVEQERRLGGKILTETVDGFVVEGGPDSFLSEKPWVFELSDRLGIEDRLMGSDEAHGGTYVLSGGRLHRLPEGLVLMVPTRIAPFLTTRLISWPGKLRMALDLCLPRKAGGGDESLASFVTRRLGREALDKIAEPLVAGIHGGDPGTMSLQASFPRFLQMEREHGSLIRAMLVRRSAPPANPAPRNHGRTYFMSFAGGMGELPAAAAARLDPARIVLGRGVTRIERRAAGGPAAYTVHVEGMDAVVADAVIVATPSKAAADLLDEVDADIAGRLRAIPFTSSANVTLAFRRADIPRPLKGFGFVVPSNEGRRIMGATYSSLKWRHRTPDEGTVLMRVFLGGARQREAVLLSDAEMLRVVREELRDILDISAEPVMTRVFRWIDGWPQYTLGHLDRVAAIEEGLRRHPGLYLAGGSYRGIGVGDCIRSGLEAADTALAFLA